jgi:uncharacterized membrane protein YvbJ
MKKCKFCAEEVKDEAIKCKHCGSALVGTSLDPMRSTDPAKAVTKGIKQKEVHDSVFKFWAAIIAITSIVIWCRGNPALAAWIFFPSAIVLNIWYFKE